MEINLKKFNNMFWLKREKTLIIAGVVVSVGLALFVIYPAALDIGLAKGEISSLKSQLAAKQLTGYQLNDILASYQRNEAKLELFNKAVMNRNRELEFITSLESIAARHALRQKINIENYQDILGGNFAKMPVQLTLRGDFKDEVQYLEDMERLPAYISIRQINIIGGGGEGESENIISMFISADTFWQ